MTDAQRQQERKALRIMIVILIPILLVTIAALVALWPSDVQSHIRSDASSYTVEGVTTPRGTVTAVKEASCSGQAGSVAGDTSTCAEITVKMSAGPEEGSNQQAFLTAPIYASGVAVGDQVRLYRVPIPDQPASYQFAEFERTTPLIFFGVVFFVLVVLVARWRGFASLMGLGFAFFILVKFLFPALIVGRDPVWVGLVASAAIMFVVLYAAHGFSARTTTALLGTMFGLIVSAILGVVATDWAHLTGVATEDDYLLSSVAPDLKLTSVVICGIIIAGLGVMNDVTITQASAVWELAADERNKTVLFRRAMRIGRDHIASTVYTIAFASAGATLSILLLLAIYQRPLVDVLRTEQFSGELIRTLVGSIGLVMTVPLTTLVGVIAVSSGGSDKEPEGAPRGMPDEALRLQAHEPPSSTGSDLDAYRRPTDS